MEENVDLIVLFPRYTAIAGLGGPTVAPFYTAALDVRAYERVLLTAWMGTGLGTTPATAEFAVEQSADLETWRGSNPVTPPAGEETDWSVPLLYPWLRVSAAFESGDDLGVTFWVIGKFVRRDGASTGDQG